MTLYDRIEESAAHVRARFASTPEVGLVLGSGLGDFADAAADPMVFDYTDLPHFKASGVEGHAGRLVLGKIRGRTCALLQGRVHYYEGRSMEEVVHPVRVLCRLGARIVILTNAAGGIDPDFAAGDLMIIRDHINLMGAHPLRGENDERLGPRFPDMSRLYDPDLVTLGLDTLASLGLGRKSGVYAGVSGPSYETRAEVKMLAALGADAVGMSTVPEAIAAHHMGARVAGVSCITNAACGVGGLAELSHQEVTATADRVRETFKSLLCGILDGL
jgi:purine-nucleoside phosphorylase